MTHKQKFILILIISVGLVGSSFMLLLHDHPWGEEGYLLDKTIPGIVEGTAKMVDTKSYFTTHQLQTGSVQINVACNHSANLQIAIGYKEPTDYLLDASHPAKEVLLWSGGDIFPQESKALHSLGSHSASSKQSSRIAKTWNLFQIGFTPEEYVKADERVWYLKIQDTSGGPYGYYCNVTEEINGSAQTIRTFEPYQNHLADFELSFDQLTFETLLHPFFDGSTEIIVPIRGVQHELACKNPKTTREIEGYGIKGTWTTTTTSDGVPNKHWAVIFATARYDNNNLDTLDFAAIEGCMMILGTYYQYSTPYDFYHLGLFDYGWSVVYCLDQGKRYTHTMSTCTKTDDNYFEAMIDFVDDDPNGPQLSSNDQLIVFTNGHGALRGGVHATYTGNSNNKYFHMIKRNEYRNYLDDLTANNVYVFLWVKSCNGYGLGTWSGYHNSHLEVWYYDPVADNMAETGKNYFDGSSESACKWNDGEEGHYFFYWADVGKDITYIGGVVVYNFNNEEGHDETEMNQFTYWGTYDFDVNL